MHAARAAGLAPARAGVARGRRAEKGLLGTASMREAGWGAYIQGRGTSPCRPSDGMAASSPAAWPGCAVALRPLVRAAQSPPTSPVLELALSHRAGGAQAALEIEEGHDVGVGLAHDEVVDREHLAARCKGMGPRTAASNLGHTKREPSEHVASCSEAQPARAASPAAAAPAARPELTSGPAWAGPAQGCRHATAARWRRSRPLHRRPPRC